MASRNGEFGRRERGAGAVRGSGIEIDGLSCREAISVREEVFFAVRTGAGGALAGAGVTTGSGGVACAAGWAGAWVAGTGVSGTLLTLKYSIAPSAPTNTRTAAWIIFMCCFLRPF